MLHFLSRVGVRRDRLSCVGLSRLQQFKAPGTCDMGSLSAALLSVSSSSPSNFSSQGAIGLLGKPKTH